MRATYFGQSCWGIEVGDHRVVIDPYPVSQGAAVALRDYVRDGCEYVLVTHGAADHLGIGFELVREHSGCRLVSEPAVVRAARSSEIPEEDLLVIFWNAERIFGSLHVRAVETRHLSAFQSDSGEFLTGMPLGFVIWDESEPDVRMLHLGDTSLFSDLALLGELYRPVVVFIGVGAAPGFLAEMTPQEAALACFWLRADVALPMHFEADSRAADEFCAAIEQVPSAITSWVPQQFEAFSFSRKTVVKRQAV